MGNRSSISLTADTVSERVRYLAEHYPDRELFVFYQGEKRDPYTAREIFELAGKFANRLRHQYGFKRNDVIVNTLANSPERVITDLGITLAGITCLNGQILLSDGADFFLSARNSRSNGIIVRPEDVLPAWRLIKPYISGTTSSTITPLSCGKLPDLNSAILVSRKAEGSRRPLLEDLRSSKEEVFVDSTISPEDILYVFTTSGSTGYSKLVPRTHAEVIDMWVSLNIAGYKDFISTEEPVLYSDRLLGWGGGFPYSAYCGGDKRVLLDLFEGGGKRGEYVWTAIRRERCTMAIILPLDLENVINHITSTGSTDYKVKILGTSGQPFKKSHLPGMLTVAEQVLVCYGSTEAGGISCGAVTSENKEDFFCGNALSEIQLRIVDDNGEICKPRQFGTIHLKGGCVLKGYFNRVENPDPNNGKSFTKDGWLNTEDVGYQDENGNLFVMGRNKDTIIYGAAVLYPAWLESKIIEHPDVAEAAILPVSDPVLFHEICACVKPVSGSNLTEEKLKSFCESIFLADLSSELTPVPKYYMVLEAFPETATGKTDKQALLKMAEERFGVK